MSQKFTPTKPTPTIESPSPLSSSSSSYYSILFGAVNLSFPNHATSDYQLRIPLTDYFIKMQFPGVYFSTLFYLGLGAFGYFTARKLACLYKCTSTWLKSFMNARRYLNARRNETTVYTAVIYGASTTIGKMFALYLAQKGYNLILIERDMN